MALSCTQIVICVSVLLMAYWAYSIYKMTDTASCKQGRNCIKPLYPIRNKMKVGIVDKEINSYYYTYVSWWQISVYVSQHKDASRLKQNILLFNKRDFMRNGTLLTSVTLFWCMQSVSVIIFFCRQVNVSLPSSTMNNGSLFAHIFVGPDSLSSEVSKNFAKFKVVTASLTKYLPPSSAQFNLVTGEYEVK